MKNKLLKIILGLICAGVLTGCDVLKTVVDNSTTAVNITVINGVVYIATKNNMY